MRIFEADEKNFGLTQKVAEAMLQSGQGEKAMPIIERTRIPMLDAGEHEAVGRLLNELVVSLPGRIEPHEWLVDSYGRTSDSFRLPDALAQLGDALVGNGQLDRAKEVFEQLVDREPDSDSAKRKLNNVLLKLGIITPEEDASSENNLKTELEPPPAPKVRPHLETAPVTEALSPAEAEHRDGSAELDEETQKFIAQSLTDVDLFASYGLTQKAIGLLEAILRRAPRHTPTLEKLLDFVLGAGDDRRTAELASRLERLHAERGDNRSAERFAELRRRFQRAAGVSDAELAAVSEAALSSGSRPAAGADETVVEEEAPAIEIAPEPVSAEPAITEFAVPSSISEKHPASEPVVSNAAHDVHEVDLSDEWLSVLKEVEPETKSEAPAPAVESDVPEFTISDSSTNSESSASFEIPVEATEEAIAPATESAVESTHQSAFVPPADMPAVAEFQVPTQEPAATFDKSADQEAPHGAAEQEPFEIDIPADEKEREAPAETVLELPALEEIDFSAFSVEPPAGLTPPESQPVKPAAEELPELAPVEDSHEPQKVEQPAKEPVKEPEFELEQDYELILDPEPLVPAHEEIQNLVPPAIHAEPEREPALHNASTNGNEFASDRFLADLASEIEHLGMGQLTPSYSKPDVEAPVRSIDTANQSDSGPLKEVFDDFRAELGEMGSDDEDLETHYNLGTAFREMGLLEEAISEFQKVAKANERGRPFRYAMQCCTLLGLAFMEKGQPGIAAIWYERALETPGVEPESILALRYDLGIAQESAGEPEAALKSFSKVYAMNIDYRDVAERIAALQKPSR